MDAQTRWWWTCLGAVALLNVLLWALSVRRLHRLGLHVDRDLRLQALLSAGYVAGCAWRSVLPVFDVQRLVLVDSVLSSVLVGRSVATVAELCFAAQWALLLARASDGVGSRAGALVARLLVPAIAVAETASWTAVLTTSNLGHVIEESIWGACAALAAGVLAHLSTRHAGLRRHALRAATLVGAGYVAFMFAVDVPMYWARWVADEAAGRTYLTIAQGVVDVSSRWTVSHRWADWHSEVVWMTAYFSVAVWISIGLLHLRWPAPAAARPGG